LFGVNSPGFSGGRFTSLPSPVTVLDEIATTEFTIPVLVMSLAIDLDVESPAPPIL
jgi:hypothetical protein